MLPELCGDGHHTLGTTCSLTSGYHPQPKGQAEWTRTLNPGLFGIMSPWSTPCHAWKITRISVAPSPPYSCPKELTDYGFHQVLDMMCMLLSVLAPEQHFLIFLFTVPESQFLAFAVTLLLSIPLTFSIGFYIQLALEPQTHFGQNENTSPGPLHPASSSPRSSETSHPDNSWKN